MDLSKLNLQQDVRPVWVKGVPACPRDEATCPSYDGKRCRTTGFRPSDICEPAVEAMAAELDGFYRHDLDWHAAEAVAEWNDRHPTGQAVRYQSAAGTVQTATHGPAYVENGRTAVVELEEPGMPIGNSGVHLPRIMELSRLVALKEANE